MMTSHHQLAGLFLVCAFFQVQRIPMAHGGGPAKPWFTGSIVFLISIAIKKVEQGDQHLNGVGVGLDLDGYSRAEVDRRRLPASHFLPMPSA